MKKLILSHIKCDFEKLSTEDPKNIFLAEGRMTKAKNCNANGVMAFSKLDLSQHFV